MLIPAPAVPARRRTRGQVKALVAAGGPRSGRRTLDGELVWFPPPCGEPQCECITAFAGSVTRGLTDVATVRTFPDATRAELRAALAAAMCRHCVPAALAPTQAERLLLAAERLTEGTLVRRDPAGEIVPVAPGRFDGAR